MEAKKTVDPKTDQPQPGSSSPPPKPPMKPKARWLAMSVEDGSGAPEIGSGLSGGDVVDVVTAESGNRSASSSPTMVSGFNGGESINLDCAGSDIPLQLDLLPNSVDEDHCSAHSIAELLDILLTIKSGNRDLEDDIQRKEDRITVLQTQLMTMKIGPLDAKRK